MTAFPSRELAEQLVATAWSEYDATRTIDHLVEVSAHVSTNRVFRVVFTDTSHIVAKISSYGSYFLFAEDHDRLFTSAQLLRGTRWEGFLAEVLPVPYTPLTLLQIILLLALAVASPRNHIN